MKDLLPCPFCGGEATLIENEPTQGFCFVECVDCASRGSITAKEQAIAAWNTRSLTAAAVYGYQAAERTCTFSSGHNGNETEKMVLPKCSVCGVTVDGTWCDDYHTLNGLELEYAYNYCPNCGSKVIEDA